MGSVVEGLEDYIESELERLRAEVRLAIAESGYTQEQVAAFAEIGRSTLMDLLSGRSRGNIDTLIRIGFIVGAHISIERPESARSFQLVPLARGSRLSSVESRGSASSRGAERDSHTTSAKKGQKSTGDQRQRSARRKGVTGWSLRSVIDLREWVASDAGRPEMTAPESRAA